MFVEEEDRALGKDEKSSCPCILVVVVERHRGGEEDRVRVDGGEDVGGVGAGGHVVGGGGGEVIRGGGGEVIRGGGGGGLEGGRGRGRCCGATCWGAWWNWSLQLFNKLFNRYYGNSGNENNKNVPTPVEERPALVEEEANC